MECRSSWKLSLFPNETISVAKLGRDIYDAPTDFAYRLLVIRRVNARTVRRD